MFVSVLQQQIVQNEVASTVLRAIVLCPCVNMFGLGNVLDCWHMFDALTKTVFFRYSLLCYYFSHTITPAHEACGVRQNNPRPRDAPPNHAPPATRRRPTTAFRHAVLIIPVYIDTGFAAIAAIRKKLAAAKAKRESGTQREVMEYVHEYLVLARAAEKTPTRYCSLAPGHPALLS